MEEFLGDNNFKEQANEMEDNTLLDYLITFQALKSNGENKELEKGLEKRIYITKNIILERLSKNSVEEFKKILLKEINKDEGLKYDCGECNDRDKILSLINNIK